MKSLPWLALVTLVLVSGCDYGGPEGEPMTPACGDTAQASIDSGAELEITAGEGVGVFYEHLGEGIWRVTTTCDTPISGEYCYWDVLVSALGGAELGDVSAMSFESGDAFGYEYDGALHLITDTSDDTDAITLAATPGATLRFDAYLDGYCASPYVFWIGEEAVHTGAPGNPLELTPSE
jgi:hypothetical protein